MTESQPENRTRIVPVRMNPSEYADACACAEALGISLSRLMRSRAEALPPMRAVIDLQTAAELGKVGSNINQLTRAMNSGFAPQIGDLEPLLLELRELLLNVSIGLRQ